MTSPAEKKDNKRKQKYPVYFYIHGGSWNHGYGLGPLCSGVAFTQQDVVVVTLNYRLGVLGLNNLGFYDQQLALKWVVDNIGAFDGDPNKITVAGESAGGYYTACHVASPTSNKMFKRAAIMSAPLGPRALTQAGVDTQLLALHQCLCGSSSDFSCVLSKSLDDVMNAQESCAQDIISDFRPSIGSADLPIDPYTAISKGLYPDDMDLVMGCVQYEGSVLPWLSYNAVKDLSKASVTDAYGVCSV